MMENLLYILAAYLIGSIPFGYLAGRLRGVDLRKHGSCNIGATNAVRVLGKGWGIPVFVGDFAKGFLPLWWVRCRLGGDPAAFSAADMGWFLGVLLALVLGHTYTCFLGFKGGKGVATTAGCLFALSPAVGAAALAAWLLSMAMTRYVSLSSIVAGVVMLAAAGREWLCKGSFLTGAGMMLMSLLFLVFLLVVYKHRANIVRLCRGTEPKAFSKKSK